MLEKLQNIEDRFVELEKLLSDPEVIARRKEWLELTREHARLQKTAGAIRTYKKVLAELEEAREMLLQEESGSEMVSFLKEEIRSLEIRKEEIEEQLKVLLLPRDPNDDKNIIMEIRGGAGGEEAALFAGVLFRMYYRYAERQNWKTEILSTNPTDIGGFKEIVFAIEGNSAYSRLKLETGVHRVQRIPTTDSGGRIHTSTATVAVLPEAEEVDIEINADDLRVDTFCSTGPGGQSVNTTRSAIRITHIPTGVVVSCQDEKSQLKNKNKALRVLRSRLLEIAMQEQEAETAQDRKSQVGTGDRSERIRTYNYPQNRVTDHRIGLTLHKLEAVLDGDINEIIDALITHEQTKLMSAEK